MFAKTIIDSDAFLDMPLSTQALYFHLSMRADDEGFINNPKRIQRTIGASDDDLKVLLAKNFIISFDTGVIVIKHWKIHNYIRGDRLQETAYKEERAMLELKDNGAYTLNCELKVIEELNSTDIRKIAYKESTLPYSFSYKIRRAFEGKICPICGKTMTSAYKNCMPTIQHNIPISKNGKHELDNISVICESCNTSIKDNETGKLNNQEVIDIWDKIVLAEKNNIPWFSSPKLLDGQMTDICQTNVSIGKVSIGKDSIDKVSIGKDILSEKSDSNTILNDDIKDIIDYLNLKNESNYRSNTTKTRTLIKSRLKEGFTVEDFKTVIDKKVNQWKSDTKMSAYLRPETLFGTKFEGYLNEKIVCNPQSVDVVDNWV